jgi:alkanesulfonate monooxygenase SsuD/methylene tetrahydromethanopterin reductase-like flavin-dependent oxidoreductase (luciferase family)
MQLDLMIEGQEGVTWQQWLDIARACETQGIPTLFRSDHYMNLDGQHPERGSLDAIGTMIALGAQTTKLRLGTMVSPATFRHPSELAKLATTADHVSGGRFELGLGAGWNNREHAAYGFPFPDLKTRMQVLEEQLQIILGNWAEGQFSFDGSHYRLDTLDAQPKPVQRPHLPLLLGGAGGPLAARLAASYADEYNTAFAGSRELSASTDPYNAIYTGATVVRDRRNNILAACEAVGRDPIPFSVMTPAVVGMDEADLRARAERTAAFRGLDPDLVLEMPEGWLVGTVDQVAEQLHVLRELGVSRVLCQMLPHDDLDFIAVLGQELAPRVA